MVTRPLSYVFESHLIGGSWRTFVVAKCTGCQGQFKEHWGGNNNPQHIAKHLRRLGWDFDPYRQTHNKCPTCNKPVPVVIQHRPNLRSFGGRLQHIREQVHVPIKQLAAETKIPVVLLERIEEGTALNHGLDNSIPIRLADALARHGASVNADWLNGTSETDTPLAINVRRLMQNCGHTEGSLAAASRIRPSDIRMILSGHMQTYHRIDDLAKALNCKPATLTAPPISHAPKIKKARPPARQPEVQPEAPQPEAPLHLPSTGLATAFWGPNPSDWIKALRKSEKLSQGGLAKIVLQNGGTWKQSSTQVMISQIEHGDSLIPSLMSLVEIVRKVFPQAAGEQQQPAPPEHINGTALPAFVAPATALPTELQAELRQVESDSKELRGLVDDLHAEIDKKVADFQAEIQRKVLDELQPLRQMILDNDQKVESIKQALAALPPPIEQPTVEPQPAVEPQAAVEPPKQKSKPDYLSCKGGIWYFRRRVPEFARELFGVTETFACLGTTDKTIALRRKVAYQRAFDAKLNEARVS